MDAFNRCESNLGREWIERRFIDTIGALPTLSILNMGVFLSQLDGLKNTNKIIEKLKQEDHSVVAELHALSLLLTAGNFDVEIEPDVTVGTKTKNPDFVLKAMNEPSIYVEVTKPDNSELFNDTTEFLDNLMNTTSQIQSPFDLEVYFLREPSAEEKATMVSVITKFCAKGEQGIVEVLDGLAVMALRGKPVNGMITPHDFGIKDELCRLGMARVIVESGETTKKVSARVPLTDERAELFIQRKSKQLPDGGPGLLMIDLQNVLGGFKYWGPLIQRRFQPTINTRISAVCMFGGNIFLDEEGPLSCTQTKVLVNPYCSKKLPENLTNSLHEQGAEYRRKVEPSQQQNG